MPPAEMSQETWGVLCLYFSGYKDQQRSARYHRTDFPLCKLAIPASVGMRVATRLTSRIWAEVTHMAHKVLLHDPSLHLALNMLPGPKVLGEPGSPNLPDRLPTKCMHIT